MSKVECLFVLCLMIATTGTIKAQTIYQYKQDDATVCFFSKDESQYIPHLMRRYQTAKALHRQIWGTLPSQPPFMMLSDWEDDGNAGVSAIPHSMISIGMAPLNMSYFVGPSVERYDHLFKHEYTHVAMTDKTNSRDRAWRRFTGNKVVLDSKYPLSAVWSYLDAPRWYAPRWFHEGIACFMETWLCGGAGRALGGYDEAYFRTVAQHSADSSHVDLYSVVGLETEGSTADFQQGTTAYLYGMRFVNYLVLTYGYQKLVDFYNRTEDSKTFFASQFRKIYGKPLKEAWDEWKEYEGKHQQENLKKIRQYPITEVTSITNSSLGSASPMCIDEERGVAYAAVNHQGDLARIVEIDLATGKTRNLSKVDGSMLYQVTYLAYDKNGQRLIWTDRNYNWRGLVVYDLKTGKQTIHKKYQRTYDISYDNTNDCLYGLMCNEGVCHLVKYDSNMDNREILYKFPFGVSVSDLDVSHDGKQVVASLLGTKGQHSLIMFDAEKLENGILGYETICTLDDSNLSQFRFSHDDKSLVGFSYYTGVPNVWSIDLSSRKMALLTNVETGMFAPYLASNDSIYAYQFETDGMRPVVFNRMEINDANAVEYLGQKAYRANKDLEGVGKLKESLPDVSFSSVYDSIGIYKPLRELKFQGAHPDISGFVDRKAWNDVTPVLGYHFSFYDPLSLASMNLFVGASPWSNNDWSNKFHVSASLKYWLWTLSAAWNPTNFYDLFGPTRTSRKGYYAHLAYNYSTTLQSPYVINYGASVAHYGNLDALPMYQNVAVDDNINSFQSVNAYLSTSKSYSTLGAIVAESGYSFDVNANTVIAGGKLFPSVDATWAQGTLLPFGLHNTAWLRTTVGQSFGDSDSSFGNEYFGGFGNNYVDNGSINRFKTLSSMPGAEINEIGAHTYAKVQGDISFCPIRFNNFGALRCYPNFIQFNVFAADLMTDLWGCDRRYKSNYVSIGTQMNMQLVLFTHMTTTLSVGYARIFANDLKGGELMISLKLL